MIHFPFMTASHRILGFLCLLLVCGYTHGAGDNASWVLVDTRNHLMTVHRNGRILDRFENISLGRGGVTQERRAGDGKTPLGTFRIAWIKRDSPFHLFFGFDYPGLDYARRAWVQGRIDRATYFAIRDAIHRNQPPPQATALGGHIGIHGLGDADPEIHRRFNWTQGCIAVTNAQIERLAGWIGLGTRVEVR